MPSVDAQQRRNEAAELFRTRRHVSVEDTISMHSDMSLPTTTGEVRTHERQEENREVQQTMRISAPTFCRINPFLINIFFLKLLFYGGFLPTASSMCSENSRVTSFFYV